MKEILLKMLGIGVLTFGLLGCNNYTQELEDAQHLVDVSQVHLVSAQPIREVEAFNADKVHMSIGNLDGPNNTDVFNNTDETLLLNESFVLEKEVDGMWFEVPLPEDFEFGADGYILQPHSDTNLTTSVNAFFKLIPGNYRIRKEVIIDGAQGPENVVFDIFASFEVE